MGAVDQLNECLSGSPYLLDHNERGAARAEFLLEECARIEERHSAVQESFAAQSEELRIRVERMTNASVVYESNALESAGLPLAETERAIAAAPRSVVELEIYIAQQAVQSDPHLMEVLGLQRATLFARQLAEDFALQSIPVREVDVRSLHASTVPAEHFAGSYRTVEVGISGSDHVPPDAFEVSRQMQELVHWLNVTEAPPALAAAVVHSWLTIIHPFEDGNGRVARLLANVVLLRSSWPHLVVPSSDRLQYLDALSSSDEAGEILPLFDLFVKSIRRTLKQLEKPDLARRLFEADIQSDPSQRFDLWWRQLDEFLNALRSELLREGGFDMFRMGVPSASTLVLLEERDPAANTWMAKIHHKNGHDLLLWLGYMTSDMIDSLQNGRTAPSIFVSQRDDRPGATHRYRNPLVYGSPLAIDEVTIFPGASETPVAVRRGYLNVDEVSLRDAASILAREICRFADLGS